MLVKKIAPTLLTIALTFGLVMGQNGDQEQNGWWEEEEQQQQQQNGAEQNGWFEEQQQNGARKGYFEGDGAAMQRKLRGIAGFGPSSLREVPVQEQVYDLYGGTLWELNRFAALKGLVDATSDFESSGLVSARIGGNLYAPAQNFAPYIGADVGVGYLTAPNADNVGLQVGGSLGTQLFRATGAEMNLEGVFRAHFNEIEDDYPYTYGARIGIIF
jgi:hypothetical protein